MLKLTLMMEEKLVEIAHADKKPVRIDRRTGDGLVKRGLARSHTAFDASLVTHGKGGPDYWYTITSKGLRLAAELKTK